MRKDQSIVEMIARRDEEWRKEVVNVPLSEVGSDCVQTSIGTVSQQTFGRLLRGRAECIWPFLSVDGPC